MDEAMILRLAASRYEGALRHAEIDRLVGRPALRARVLVWAADRLIGVAGLVRARYAPAAGRVT